MRTLNMTFDEDDFHELERLKKHKGSKSWENFFLSLVNDMNLQKNIKELFEK